MANKKFGDTLRTLRKVKRIYPAAGCRFTGIEEQKHTWFLGGWEIRAGRLYAAQALSDL